MPCGYDSKTLPDVLTHLEASRGKTAKTAVCDRGYRGPKTVGDTQILLPAPPLKKDNRYQRDKKRKRCQRRAAIEPIIGHLKADFRLTRNFLKSTAGDLINVLMAAIAWNLKLWMRAFLWLIFDPGWHELAFKRLQAIVYRVYPLFFTKQLILNDNSG